MDKISEHFTLQELTRTAQPYPNKPGTIELQRLKSLCDNVLEPVRAHYGKPVKVNSAYRSLQVNRAIGSKDTSDHCKGAAADIEIDGVSNADLAEWIRDNLEYRQLILEAARRGNPSAGWVHVSYLKGDNRKQVLTMELGSHGPVYSKGLNI